MQVVIAVIGSPGVGKSSLIKQWMTIQNVENWVEETTIELLHSHVYQKNTYVLGKYNLSTKTTGSEGTDKLSFVVQSKLIEFLTQNKNQRKLNIIFEGDRLTTVKIFQKIKELGYQLTIIKLNTHESEIQRRFTKRHSNQAAAFIKGRKTKTMNICKEFTTDCIEKSNNNYKEQAKIIQFISSKINLN